MSGQTYTGKRQYRVQVTEDDPTTANWNDPARVPVGPAVKSAQPLRILRLPEVLVRTGLSRSTVYEMIGNSAFPRPVGLSARTVGWLEQAIEDWIATRITIGRL